MRKELALLGIVDREAARHVTVEPVRQLDRSECAAFDLPRTDDKSPPLAGFLRLDPPLWRGPSSLAMAASSGWVSSQARTER